MAKIQRYEGNLQAFASAATGQERVIFGNDDSPPVQSDDLTTNINSNFARGWGVLPLGNKPPREWFNSVAFAATQLSAYQHQVGVPEWDDEQEYHEGSIVNVNGDIFSSRINDNVGVNPSNDSDWKLLNTTKETVNEILVSTKNYKVGQVVSVLGFHVAGDGGAGSWVRVDESGAPSQAPFNTGGAYIFDGAGNRWDFVSDSDYISVSQMGAKPDNSTDGTAAFQATFKGCQELQKKMLIPGGEYFLLNGFVADYTDKATEADKISPSIIGAGAGVTLLRSGNSDFCIKIQGGVGPALHKYIEVGGFHLQCANGAALNIDNCAFARFADIFINGSDDGIIGTDLLTCIFEKIRIRFIKRGITFTSVDGSRPNAIDFHQVHVGTCSEYGALSVGGSLWNWYGGTVEGTGAAAGDPNSWGIKVQNNGLQGEIGLNVDGIYFEGNRGAADVWIDSGDVDCVHNVSNSIFTRLSDSSYTNTNIRIDQNDGQGDGVPTVNIRGNAHSSKNSYVPSAARPYVRNFSDRAVINIRDYSYDDPIERPNLVHDGGFATCVFSGADGNIVKSKNVTDVTRDSLGRYTVTFAKPMKVPYYVNVFTPENSSFGYKAAETDSTVVIETTNTNNNLADFPEVFIDVTF